MRYKSVAQYALCIVKVLLGSMSVLPASVIHAQSPTLTPQPTIAPQPTPLAVPKIPYQRGVPAAVLHLLPRGAKSCFWGTFRPKSNEPLYGVHLFDPRPDIGFPSEWNRKQEFVLDVFRVQRTSFRRINRLAVNYRSAPPEVSKFGAKWTWVYRQPQRVLVLQFDIWTNTRNEYGNLGENVYVSFPQGLQGRAAVQALPFGAWHATGSSGQTNYFVRGSDGRTEIYGRILGTGQSREELVETNEFTLHWDPRRGKFWPGAKARRALENFEYLR